MSGSGGAQVRGESVGLAAYGPWWDDFRASVSVDEERSNAEAEGIVFRLNQWGYYAALHQTIARKGEYFKLVKQRWFDQEEIIVQWTKIQRDLNAAKNRMITVECKGNQITIYLDGLQAAKVKADSFVDGHVGMTKIGSGRALFRDLQETLLSPNVSR